MGPQINARGMKIIEKYEACRLVAYLPTPNDVPTIGYGHTAGVKLGDVCSQDQAEAWLLEDVSTAESIIVARVAVPLTSNQFSALVSLIFNIGIGNFEQSTLLRDLNAGDYDIAAQQFLVWDKQRGVDLPGLDARRAEEKALFETPDDE